MKELFSTIYNQKGFTLVEILVVLGLFSTMSVFALGALFNAQAINGHLQETEAVLDNLNLSAQTIMRDIRFGSNFHCDTVVPSTGTTTRRNCVSGSQPGVALLFRPSDAVNVKDRSMYYVDKGVIYRDDWDGVSGARVAHLQMTSGEVSVKTISFYVDGAFTGSTTDALNGGFGFDYKQPLITLLISGVTKPKTLSSTSSLFNIETHISPREIDIQ